jgi:membrane-associated phospholipid phosphatase
MKEIFITFRERVSAQLMILFIIFTGLAIGFVGIADEVLEGDTLRVDESILRMINNMSTPALDQFFIIATNFGGVIGIVGISLVVIAVLLKLRKYRDVVFFAVGLYGAVAINTILKLVFERTRPDLWERLVIETSYSFPSGHALASSALALTIIILCYKTKWFIPALIIGGAYGLIIAFSRLYLGVHYPTDIIGGWLISSLWVIAVYWMVKRVKH